MKYVILAGLLLLVLVEYALMVVAHDADERAERMYREWKEKKEKERASDDAVRRVQKSH